MHLQEQNSLLTKRSLINFKKKSQKQIIFALKLSKITVNLFEHLMRRSKNGKRRQNLFDLKIKESQMR